MAEIISGKIIACASNYEIAKKLSEIKCDPRLDVLLVGNDPRSEVYVRNKQKLCEELGIKSVLHRPRSEAETVDTICQLNQLKECNGILVQLPLPKDYNATLIFDLIDPLKDVDVLNPVNVGLLVQNRARFLPPTPHAVRRLIKYVTTLPGKHVVVINRSIIVGKPLSSMLIQDDAEYANSTVTVCHDQTPAAQLKELCLHSDIIVVAVGIPNFLTADMTTEQHVIIDVGINDVEGKIVGDVHPFVKEKVKYITPVPGGVGPVTVSMLMYNTVEAARLQC